MITNDDNTYSYKFKFIIRKLYFTHSNIGADNQTVIYLQSHSNSFVNIFVILILTRQYNYSIKRHMRLSRRSGKFLVFKYVNPFFNSLKLPLSTISFNIRNE